MITKSLKIMSSVIVDESVQWDNEWKPCSGVTDIDRTRHFTNLNEGLLKKIRQVKAD